LQSALGEAIHAPTAPKLVADDELDRLRETVQTLRRELSAAESELRDSAAGAPRTDVLDLRSASVSAFAAAFTDSEHTAARATSPATCRHR